VTLPIDTLFFSGPSDLATQPLRHEPASRLASFGPSSPSCPALRLRSA